MKLIQRLSLLASIALVAIACDIQQTFDDRINDKQLLVLAPDFADTSVQLVFRDPETLAVIDEDFEVTVYANKRLIDANGNYKNEFIARGGVMEFFVSPEETVSEGDPLEIAVEAISFDQTIEVRFQKASISKIGFSKVLIIPTPSLNSIINEANTESYIETKKNITIGSKETEDLKLQLSFNGTTSDRKFEIDNSSYRYRIYPHYYHEYGANGRNSIGYTFLPLGTNRLQEHLEIKVEGPTNMLNYILVANFVHPNLTQISYTVDQSGTFSKDEHFYLFGKWQVISTDGTFLNYNHSLGLAINSQPMWFTIKWHDKKNYKVCSNGFNLKFEGLDDKTETSILYRAIRSNDGQTFLISADNISGPNYRHSSIKHVDNHIIGISGNTLEFAENAQYYIEPQSIELGGEELCGNTYTVKLIPRENHSKYNLNLSMRCEEDEVGVAPTFSALYRKKGGDEASWETVSFKKGSTSLYLEEGAVYEVKGTFSDRAFEFEFTNEASKIAEAVSGTRNGNTAVKDITYTIESGDTGSQSINANVVFYAADCLIN